MLQQNIESTKNWAHKKEKVKGKLKNYVENIGREVRKNKEKRERLANKTTDIS